MTAPSSTRDVATRGTRQKLRWGLGFFLLVLTQNFSIAASPPKEIQTDGDISLLINADVDPSELSLSSLRAIFTMRKRSWHDDTPITVVVLPDNDQTHQLFCKSVLKIYPFVLREQWDRLIFSGTGIPPTIVKDIDALREAISETPGAIGYTIKTKQSRSPESSHVEQRIDVAPYLVQNIAHQDQETTP